MADYAQAAIQSTLQSNLAFCKFLSANDTGLTGAHQAGIYISKPAVPIIFSEPGIRGENKERWINISWQDGSITQSRCIYYGVGSRNEYRITNFGRGFPFLRADYTGALFVLAQQDEENYQGFVLNDDEDINDFLDAFGLSPTETNRLIAREDIPAETIEQQAIEEFILSLTVDFPASEMMSAAARQIYALSNRAYGLHQIGPDQILLRWTDEEYRIFRAIEHARYGDIIRRGFSSVDDFVTTANQVLNRRKSRAGKSLEHHLGAIFDSLQISYTAQAITEGNKRPDFLFPSEAAYHNRSFPTDRLISLAAKTTCKDRWRQVINEADRLRDSEKYLCTLQQGISPAQMDEMQAERVILVVPQPYISAYPRDRQNRIWTLNKFLSFVQEKAAG